MNSPTPRRARFELLALTLGAVLVAAFILSFIFGLRATRPSPLGAPELSGAPIRVETPRNHRRVEVLNAAGRAGLAREITGVLRNAGFDVVYFGNAAAESVSVVIDRVNRRDFARDVAHTLGIDSVVVDVDSTRLVEASVILGKNWGAKDSIPD